MNETRKISLSLAVFVLICFFLPWVELSCLGLRDSVSGLDLARSGDRILWIVPLSMLVIVLVGVSRSASERLPAILALCMTAGGSISAYAMFHERSTITNGPRLVAAQWTVFFWLGLLACLGIVAAGFASYARRSRSP